MTAVAILVVTVAIEQREAPARVEADDTTGFVEIGSLADALEPAVRWPASTVTPGGAMVPPAVATTTEHDTISFNHCAANLVRDDDGELLGLVGAAHCVTAQDNVMYDGATFAGGTSSQIERSAIAIDPVTDVFYSGLDGHGPTDVRTQLVTNDIRADVVHSTPGEVFVMTGYPMHHTSGGESVTLSLSFGGIVHWPNDPVDTIAMFGDRNDRDQSCSSRASGSGLYAHVDGHGDVVIAVLASHAEFERVQTMPYSDEYGHELCTFFEHQLDRPIEFDYLCGFASPTPVDDHSTQRNQER